MAVIMYVPLWLVSATAGVDTWGKVLVSQCESIMFFSGLVFSGLVFTDLASTCN